MIGEVLDSRYIVQGVVSNGSVGVNLLAKDQITGAEVLIKRMKKQGNASQIRNEIRANELMAGAPQICPYHGQFETNRDAYLIFDHIKGIDLFELMEERHFQPLPESAALFILRMVSRSLYECHQRKLSHCDIKLENIMVDFDRNEATLIDFGLSICFEMEMRDGAPQEVPITTGYRGSVEYVAPEVLIGTPFYATKGDSWALGITAYALLFGEFPYGVEDIIPGRGHPYPADTTSVPIPSNAAISQDMREKLSKLLTFDSNTRGSIRLFL